MTGNFRGEEWEGPVLRAAPEREMEVADFARVCLGIDLDAKQEEVLRKMGRRGILKCTRQWGKSTVAAAKAVHRAYTVPGTEVLVASPGERQSGEFVRKAAAMVRKLGLEVKGDGYNPASLLFPNESRIVGLPGTEGTIRGFSRVSLLLIDEAARVTDGLYRALWPMLAVRNGDLWLMSTPKGKQGFFYDVWSSSGDGWRVSVPATECPRISAGFLEEARRELGTSFGQEFMCEFANYGAGAFDRDVVERALDELEEAWEFEPVWRG